jgi:hypothetical protein
MFVTGGNMPWFEIVLWLGSLLGIVAVPLLAFASHLWRMYGKRSAAGEEPRCRGCGYMTCNNAGRICPECGCDLRTIGVRSGAIEGRPPPRIGFIIGGGIVLASLAVYVAPMVLEWLPHWYTTYDAIVIIPTGTPATRPGFPPTFIQVGAGGTRRIRHHRPDHIHVVC